MNTITVRGRTFEAKYLIDIHLFNLVEPFHSNGGLGQDNIARLVLDPIVQRRVAFALKAVFPDLTDDFVIYEEIIVNEGTRVKAQLNVTSEELYEIITQLGILTQAAVAEEKKRLQAEQPPQEAGDGVAIVASPPENLPLVGAESPVNAEPLKENVATPDPLQVATELEEQIRRLQEQRAVELAKAEAAERSNRGKGFIPRK